MWFISEKKEEWRSFSEQIGKEVVVEFSGSDKVRPGMRVIGTEDSKIGFNLLIGPLGLFICLWVVSGGKTYIIM
jgi:hypothetical protein